MKKVKFFIKSKSILRFFYRYFPQVNVKSFSRILTRICSSFRLTCFQYYFSVSRSTIRFLDESAWAVWFHFIFIILQPSEALPTFSLRTWKFSTRPNIFNSDEELTAGSTGFGTNQKLFCIFLTVKRWKS